MNPTIVRAAVGFMSNYLAISDMIGAFAQIQTGGERMIRIIYVSQYDGWWSFTPQQWREWLKTAVQGIKSGDGYGLPDANQIRHRPRCVRQERTQRGF